MSTGRTRLITWTQIAAASFVVLLQELALIRWLPAQVRAIGYFPNVVLLAAFLGLGAGSLLASRRSLLVWWPAALALLTGVSTVLHGIVFTQEAGAEHLYLLYLD